VPDERSRLKVVQALSEKLGPEMAAALMECVPPFPWTDIATKHDLAELEARMNLRFEVMETKFDALEVKLDGRLDGFEGRMTALIQEKLSAQNRGLLLVASAAVIGSVIANLVG
jgi:hypothetical protein